VWQDMTLFRWPGGSEGPSITRNASSCSNMSAGVSKTHDVSTKFLPDGLYEKEKPISSQRNTSILFFSIGIVVSLRSYAS
jgi:hypothetical protein